MVKGFPSRKIEEKLGNFLTENSVYSHVNTVSNQINTQIKGNETNGVSGIIDDLNSIEIPEEIKNSNNQK